MQFFSKVFVCLCILSFHPPLGAQAIPDPADEIELSVDMSIENTAVEPDGPINYSFTVTNLSTSVVATNVILKLTYLTDSEIDLPQDPVTVCEDDSRVITCTISELAPSASIEIDVSARADSDRNRIYLAGGVVESDQPLNPPPQLLFIREFIEVEHPEPPEVPDALELQGTVDLGIDIVKSRTTELESVSTMRVFNQHSENVATAPVVDIHLLEQEGIVSSDSCTFGDNQTIRCELPEIGPEGDYTFDVLVKGYSDTITLRMEVESPQPDRDIDNNVYSSSTILGVGIPDNAQIFIVPEDEDETQEQGLAIPTESSTAPQNSVAKERPIHSGTGAFSYQLIILLLVATTRMRSRCPGT